MSIYLLGVDPGMRNTGVALFQDGELLRAWLVDNPVRWERGPVCWHGMAHQVALEVRSLYGIHELNGLALEFPQVYATKNHKGDQDDIVQLAATVGAIAALVPAKVRFGWLPRQWKGQVPKGIHNNRIISRLKPGEFERIDCDRRPHLKHNVVDAVGIGLFALAHQGTRKPWPKDKTAEHGTRDEATELDEDESEL